MVLNWSTFLLEIINFLILVWILKRFLYKPVRDVIEQRKRRIDDSLVKADTVRKEAEAMKDQYQQRLSDWEEEKKKAFEALHNEINSERTRLMQALQTSLQQEREKSHILEQRQVEESRRKNEEQALLNGAEFTARLLGQLNHPELQNRLFELVLEQLPTMPADKWESLRALYKETQPTVKIVSAFPIAATQQHALQQELSRLAEVPVTCEFIEDESLIAGLRINFGPFVVRANLQDELQFFTESAYGRQ